jgi:hypothetical protein
VLIAMQRWVHGGRHLDNAASRSIPGHERTSTTYRVLVDQSHGAMLVPLNHF